MWLGLGRVMQHPKRDEPGEELLVGIVPHRLRPDAVDQRIGVLPVIVGDERPREIAGFPPQRVLRGRISRLERGIAVACPELIGDRVAGIVAQVPGGREEEAGILLIRARQGLQQIGRVRVAGIKAHPGAGSGLTLRGQAADFGQSRRGVRPGQRLEACPFVLGLQHAAPKRQEGGNLAWLGQAGPGPCPPGGFGRMPHVARRLEGRRTAQERRRTARHPRLALAERGRLVRLVGQRLLPAEFEQALLRPVRICLHEACNLGGARLAAGEQPVVGDQLFRHRVRILSRHGLGLVPVVRGHRIHRRLDALGPSGDAVNGEQARAAAQNGEEAHGNPRILVRLPHHCLCAALRKGRDAPIGDDMSRPPPAHAAAPPQAACDALAPVLGLACFMLFRHAALNRG